MTAVRILYNLAFPLVLLVLLPRFIFRMIKRGKYRHKFGQRFAIYSPRVRKKLSRGGWTWVHAVSVGEVMIALKLIRELRSREPELPVVLSTTTSTGYALASKEKDERFEAIEDGRKLFAVSCATSTWLRTNFISCLSRFSIIPQPYFSTMSALL